MATYVNDLRLKEIATGDEAGTWGASTNTNLELIAEAFSFGTEASFSSDADATTTIADGSTDPARSLYLKVTSGASLTATRTLTIAPNTISKVWIIENATSGSQSINISQGSGANVTIANGDVKVVYSDGAGSGAAVVDAFTDLNLAGTTTADALTVTNNATVGGTLGVTGVVTANAGVVVDNITIDGTEIDLSSGDLTIDVAGEINFDAGGGDFIFLDDGSEIGRLANVTAGFALKSSASNKDLVFVGSDAGVETTALTLDMSAAGAATFNAGATFGGQLVVGGADSADLALFHGTTGGTGRGLKISLSGEGATNQVVNFDSIQDFGILVFKTAGTERGRFTSSGLEVTGTLVPSGAITANAGVVVDNITIDGTEIDLSSGDLTIDVAGDINLDADGGNIKLSDGGTEIGRFLLSDSNHLKLKSIQSNADIKFQGNDGGSPITALTLDMSAAGAATFNAGGTFGGVLAVNSGTTNTVATFTSSDSGAGINLTDDSGTSNIQTNGANLRIGVDEDGAVSSSAIQLRVDGATKATLNDSGVFTCDGGVVVDNITIDGTEIDLSSGDLTLDVAGNIDFDADGGEFRFKDGGTLYATAYQGGGGNFYIASAVADKDLIFQGNDSDGGGTITALTLDMSQAGAATFGGNLTVNGADVTVTANIKHAGDTDTFYGFHGNNLYRVVTGGLERFEVSDSGIVINDVSEDYDFRVESNSKTHMLFVDGGNNLVNIGGSTDRGGLLNIETSDNTSQLVLVSTDGDASSGPRMDFLRASGTPADDDSLAQIRFIGQNDASEDVTYAAIAITASDVSDGTEDGQFKINTMVAGTSTTLFKMNSSEVVLNESSKDIDFRVESDSDTHALFLDAANSNVGINVPSNLLDTNLQLYTATSSAITPLMKLQGNHSANDSTEGTSIDFVESGDATAVGSRIIGTRAASGANMDLRFHTGRDDFAMVIDNSQKVGIGESSPDTLLHITTSSTGDLLTLESTGSGNGQGPNINLFRNSSSPAANDLGPALFFTGENSAGGQHTYANIYSQFTDVTDGAEDATVHHQISIAGTARSVLSLKSSEVTVNEESQNVDFRVESDSNTHMLFLDAANDRIGIGEASSPSATLHVNSGANNEVIRLQSTDTEAFIHLKDLTGSSYIKGRGDLRFEVGGNDVVKMFSSETVINDGSNDYDFRVESNGNTHMLFVDAGNDRVGVGSSSPATTLTVEGSSANGIELNRNGADATQSARLFFDSSTNASAIYNVGGTLTFASGATPGAGSGTSLFEIASDGSLSTPTSGTSNVRFGVNAGNSIASGGNYNTVVGDEAGTGINTGDNNTFVGYASGDALTTGTESVAFGSNALSASVGADKNTALGAYALRNDTEGESSVAVGHQALNAQNFSSTTTSYNVAVGANAGVSVTTGVNNTIIGGLAGDALTDADFNVAVGQGALSSDSLGSRSVAIGTDALTAQNPTDGSGNNEARDMYNVAVGYYAGVSVTEGKQNTFIGGLAGDANTIGNENVALGYNALGSNVSGDRTVAIGYGALAAQNNGTSTFDADNTAVGFNAMVSLTTGTRNVAIGSGALDAADDDGRNVAIGYGALSAMDTGNSTPYNVAIGYQAGTTINTAVENTFVGGLAGDATDDGKENTAIGYQSLSENCGNGNSALGRMALRDTTGTHNTAIGHQSGILVGTGNDNTFLGKDSGATVTSGSNNVLLGHDAGASGSPGGSVTTQSNIIGLGDENITSLNAQVSLTVASDERDKTDFTDLDVGLDFVKQLKPYTYKWDKRSKYGDKTADDYDLNAQTPDGTHKEDWLDVGFKAQEVEALEQAAGYDKANKTNLAVTMSEDGKQYGMKYEKLIPILTKAIQEQQALIESLTTRITALEGE